jgi:hypothetical protein
MSVIAGTIQHTIAAMVYDPRDLKFRKYEYTEPYIQSCAFSNLQTSRQISFDDT